MWTGLCYARHNRHLRATMMRATGFFLFAGTYWALLPLVARMQIAGGPGLYGMLFGVIGIGAVGGALLLPWLKPEAGAIFEARLRAVTPQSADRMLSLPRAALRLVKAPNPLRCELV
jgi:Transmembrane secretion effector